MIIRVRVKSDIASEVEVPGCTRVPVVGQRFRVTLGESVLEFGRVLELLEVIPEPGDEGYAQQAI